ncbi:homeobox protein [Megavirus baoshan]|uniref:Homeobox protein n=1 Tax=Megavirus baoshan TaxID=2496520 RepID=A0A3S8UYJ3_9VIRU|nr:homeobox protein [Megavirus baoshan]AZL89768.1 homeobox protein [Megavirus baoshan]
MENLDILELNAAITLVSLRRNSVNIGIRKKNPQNKDKLNNFNYKCYPKKYQDILTFIYQQQKYPDPYMYKNLSITLGLTIHQIQTWFQNRRSRDNKKNILDNQPEINM